MKIQKTFNENTPKLYLVATPIGNLEDITIRAINTLKMVDAVYCEDTRNSLKLFNHYDIKTPLFSYHLFNENEISTDIIKRIKSGENVAVISDAGLPCISDPGWVAVKEAIENDIDVVTVPGASAGISALIASGLTTYKFLFVGFLNSKKAKREKELEKLLKTEETLVMYESPHRIEETLKILSKLIPTRRMVLAREISKKFETYYRGTPLEIMEVLDTIKGEIVLVIEGNERKEIDESLNNLSLNEHYEYYLKMNMTPKDALKETAKDLEMSKNDLYKILFQKQNVKE